MCLCLRLLKELAPTGSYVQWDEVRGRIMEAHHVDPKSGDGARHAGNLILLLYCITTTMAADSTGGRDRRSAS